MTNSNDTSNKNNSSSNNNSQSQQTNSIPPLPQAPITNSTTYELFELITDDKKNNEPNDH